MCGYHDILRINAFLLVCEECRAYLDDVVSVLVPEEGFGTLMKLSKNGCGLFDSTVLEDALDDPTAVRMCRYGMHVSPESVYHELEVFWGHALDALLYHMVAILVLNKLQHRAVEFLHYADLLVETH